MGEQPQYSAQLVLLKPVVILHVAHRIQAQKVTTELGANNGSPLRETIAVALKYWTRTN